MTDTDLCYLDAREALRLFRTRELSPVDVLEAQIARADAVEGRVNALASTFFDEALEAARRSEARYAGKDGGPGRLEGLTLAVKEDTAVAGKLRTFGSLIFADNLADHTNPSVASLVDEGAIIHALTTCPEFVWPWTCTSRLHGVTRNPWNTAITCGASSGGAAAAVAAGTTTLATGSDSAGSIRMPAAMCGITGYKPPYGRNPGSPEVAMDPFFHIGPMTRTSGDAALVQNTIANGPHGARDPAHVPGALLLPEHPAGIEGLKVAWSEDLGSHAVSQAVRRNTRQIIETALAGASVEEIATPWVGDMLDAFPAWGGMIYADEFSDAVKHHPDLVCDYTVIFAQHNELYTPRMFHACMKAIGDAWLKFMPDLARHDVFICPTVGATEIPADLRDWEHPVSVDGVDQDIHSVIMTPAFNAFSRLPVLSVPSGFDANGVPTGVQIVGNPFDEETVFRVAHAIESLVPLYGDTATRPPLDG